MAFQLQFRPEMALRKAKDLQRIGSMRDACDTLHDVLTSKKMSRPWSPAHEDMMMEYINLCTELRETRRTKDGLYHYRGLTQVQNTDSLERVVTHMIDTASRKAAEARARAEVDTAKIEDLEDEDEAPESILMGSVSSDGARERAERDVLVPWLRHMWDTYRNVLDNVRYVPKLEDLYHKMVFKAMQFCKSYNRPNEFKKLCVTLRGHWVAQKRSQESQEKTMTDSQVHRHLSTRFQQLEYCADLNLWNEAFRTVEDIHSIMVHAASLSPPVKPKAQHMATYYEKLARIFWVSENYLFHAFAWFKFYELSAEKNKSLSDEDKKAMASAVVLAALAIPLYAAGPGTGANYNSSSDAADPAHLDEDSGDRDKKSKLATLLKHNTIPSREGLMAEIAAKGVLAHVRPEVAEIFNVLERGFQPLTIVQAAQNSMCVLRAATIQTVTAAGTLGSGTAAATVTHSLSQYVPNLERLLVLRLVEQLGAVYSSVRISTFQSLVASATASAGFSLTLNDIEKLVVRAVKNRQLSVRIDHRGGCWRMGDTSIETTAMRRQLTELASRLKNVVSSMSKASIPQAVAAAQPAAATGPSAVAVADLFRTARERLNVEQREVVRRRDEIEIRKMSMEDQQEQRRKQEEERLRAEAEARAAEERERLEREKKERAEKARIEDEARKAREAMEALAKKHGIVIEAGKTKEMVEREISEKQQREIADEERRKVEQAKRIDYLTRALREAEMPLIQAASDTQMAEDEEYVKQAAATILADAQARFEAASKNRERMSRMVDYKGDFEDKIFSKRSEAYEGERAKQVEKERAAFWRVKTERARARREESVRAAQEAQRARDQQAEVERQRTADSARFQATQTGRGDMSAPSATPSSGAAFGEWRSRGPAAPETAAAPAPTAAAAAFAPPVIINRSGAVAGAGWREREAQKQFGGPDRSAAAAPNGDGAAASAAGNGAAAGGWRARMAGKGESMPPPPTAAAPAPAPGNAYGGNTRAAGTRW